MVMIVVVVVVMVMIVVVVVVMVMIVMLVLVVIMVMIVFMLVMIIVEVIGVLSLDLHSLYPAGALHDLSHIEVVGVEDFRDVNLTVGCLDDLRVGLQRLDNLKHIRLLLFGNLVELVENDGGAVLDLLNEEVLDILLVEVVLHQVSARAELVGESFCVDNGSNAVKTRNGRKSRLRLSAVEHAD